MAKWMLFKALNLVTMEERGQVHSQVLMVTSRPIYHKWSDYRMDSSCRLSHSMAPRVLETLNSLQDRELSHQVSSMDRQATLLPQVVECSQDPCPLSVTRSQERRSLLRSTPRSSLSSVLLVSTPVSKERIDMCHFKTLSKFYLLHLSNCWGEMLQLVKTWDLLHRREVSRP